jgi:hypothetical protein
MDNQPTSNKQRPKCIGATVARPTYPNELTSYFMQIIKQAPSPIKKHRVGILKGTFVLPLPDDFDETLADFQEYL